MKYLARGLLLLLVAVPLLAAGAVWLCLQGKTLVVREVRFTLDMARAISQGVRESDFMPDVADLPEFMSQAEFEHRFGGVDGPG